MFLYVLSVYAWERLHCECCILFWGSDHEYQSFPCPVNIKAIGPLLLSMQSQLQTNAYGRAIKQTHRVFH